VRTCPCRTWIDDTAADISEVLSMRRLGPSSEAEMVALFLRTELPVARSRDDLRALLERARLSERVAVGEPGSRRRRAGRLDLGESEFRQPARITERPDPAANQDGMKLEQELVFETERRQ